jgi:hypothetical protein
VIALELLGYSRKARIKVFQNGVWLPLTPVDIFTMESKQYFPAVFTSKLMIEFVKLLETTGPSNNEKVEIPGAWVPDSVEVTETKIYASRAPYNVNLSIANEEPFFSHQGVLPGEAPIPVTGLKEAVNRFLDESGRTEIPLTITAAEPAKIDIGKAAKPPKIKIGKFEASIVTVSKKLMDPEDGRLIKLWEREAVATVAVGQNTKLTEVRFEIRTELTPERMLLAPAPVEPSRACLVDARYGAAQGFAALSNGTSLAGLDLFLRPAQLPIKATLQLCPDDIGRPAAQPFPGASVDVEIDEEGEGPPQPRWVAFPISRPPPVYRGPWWTVLQVEEGEIHWCVVEESEIYWCLLEGSPEPVLGTMYRVADGPWVKRLSADTKKNIWGLVRLRVDAPDPPGVNLSLRRNSLPVPLRPDSQGRVKAYENTLKTLNKNDALKEEKLELVVRGDAAGTVSITNPCIKFRPYATKSEEDR